MKVRTIQIVGGLACTMVFLALALYRVPLATVGSVLKGADPIWIGAAIATYAVNLSLRAWRLQIILRPAAVIPYSTVAKALVVGYGLNTVMPARLGELFRAEFVNMHLGLSRLWTLTSIVVERLFDGLTVVACLGVGLLLAAATRRNAAVLIDVLLTGGILFGVILLAALCLAGETVSRLFTRFPRLSGPLIMVRQGFHILRTRRMVAVAALTLMVYLPDARSFTSSNSGPRRHAARNRRRMFIALGLQSVVRLGLVRFSSIMFTPTHLIPAKKNAMSTVIETGRKLASLC